MVRNIEDPEHPLTLEQLRVVSMEQVHVDLSRREVRVGFTPTIPHCSSAAIIGLMIRTKLVRNLPEHFKVGVFVTADRGGGDEGDTQQRRGDHQAAER